MPLFHIQDPDRPMHVIAKNYEDALQRWVFIVKSENNGDEGDPPLGIHYVCDDNEIAASNWALEKFVKES